MGFLVERKVEVTVRNFGEAAHSLAAHLWPVRTALLAGTSEGLAATGTGAGAFLPCPLLQLLFAGQKFS